LITLKRITLVILVVYVAILTLSTIFNFEIFFPPSDVFFEYRKIFDSEISKEPIKYGIAAFILYLISCVLCLPILTFLVIGNGFFFGMSWGALISSFGATLGALITFVISRHLFQDHLARKLENTFDRVNKEFCKYGVLYILSLRLIPVIPYQLINILFGLTKVSPVTFCWSSQLGMLPIQLILVNAGVQMSELNKLDEIFSPKAVISLILLASIPICIRVLNKIETKRAMVKDEEKY
tara:strand:- start:433 stop:1146 length:714 start_codon:yes stop_codon:yes gene_type:complete